MFRSSHLIVAQNPLSHSWRRMGTARLKSTATPNGYQRSLPLLQRELKKLFPRTSENVPRDSKENPLPTGLNIPSNLQFQHLPSENSDQTSNSLPDYRHSILELRPASEALRLLSNNHNVTKTLTVRTSCRCYKSDFLKVYPLPIHRRFQLPGDEPRFELLRHRDPKSLSPLNEYMLVFSTPEEAAVFRMESQGSFINGVSMKYWFLPDEELERRKPRVPLYVQRNQCVIVRGFPRHMRPRDLLADLWTYDFLFEEDQAMQLLWDDSTTGTTVYLLQFADARHARRFVRQFNGSEYGDSGVPLICEILD